MMISMHEMSCLFACEMLNNVSHQVNYKQIKQIKLSNLIHTFSILDFSFLVQNFVVTN